MAEAMAATTVAAEIRLAVTLHCIAKFTKHGWYKSPLKGGCIIGFATLALAERRQQELFFIFFLHPTRSPATVELTKPFYGIIPRCKRRNA